MSGGSFDYLCYKSAEEIMARQDTVVAMRDRLIELGFAPDAAAETENVLLTIRQYETLIKKQLDRLGGVWHAVEWYDSGDSGRERILVELGKYRGYTTDNCRHLDPTTNESFGCRRFRNGAWVLECAFCGASMTESREG